MAVALYGPYSFFLTDNPHVFFSILEADVIFRYCRANHRNAVYLLFSDTAVQTIETQYEDGYRESFKPKTSRKDDIKEETDEMAGIKEEKEGKMIVVTEESNSRVTELIEYSEQVRNKQLNSLNNRKNLNEF